MISPVKIWRNQSYNRKLLNKKGEVISWTVVRVPPGTHSAYAPYLIALVQLEGEERIIAPCVDMQIESMKHGMAVKTVLRRMMPPDSDGVIPYGIKVVPLG
jgi:uncharacterized OB-fold protein